MKDIDIVFNKLKKECIDIILKQKVSAEELSFRLGCSPSMLISLLKGKNEDISIYLKLYDVLVNW